jgi:hypothetical protein
VFPSSLGIFIEAIYYTAYYHNHSYQLTRKSTANALGSSADYVSDFVMMVLSDKNNPIVENNQKLYVSEIVY